MRDHYPTLGLDRDAEREDVRAAARRRAKQCHPDLHPGDAAATGKFTRLAEAYETLSEPAAQEAYDRRLDQAERKRRERAAAPRPDAVASSRKRRPAPRAAEIRVSLRQAHGGAEIATTVRVSGPCPTGAGQGALHGRPIAAGAAAAKACARSSIPNSASSSRFPASNVTPPVRSSTGGSVPTAAAPASSRERAGWRYAFRPGYPMAIRCSCGSMARPPFPGPGVSAQAVHAARRRFGRSQGRDGSASDPRYGFRDHRARRREALGHAAVRQRVGLGPSPRRRGYAAPARWRAGRPADPHRGRRPDRPALPAGVDATETIIRQFSLLAAASLTVPLMNARARYRGGCPTNRL